MKVKLPPRFTSVVVRCSPRNLEIMLCFYYGQEMIEMYIISKKEEALDLLLIGSDSFLYIMNSCIVHL